MKDVMKNGSLSDSIDSPHDLINEKKTAAFLAAIVKSSNDAIIGKSKDFKIIYWNKGAEKLYGYSPEEVLGKHISLLIPDERREEPQIFIENFSKGFEFDHYETERRKKDGSIIYVSLTISPIIFPDGNIIGFSSTARDITKSVKLKKGMAEEIREKELLLKEIHHRIKNNLQIIVSLINLQASYSNDQITQKFIKETNERIRTMALIYNQLYISEDFRSADLKNYFEELITSLFTAYGLDKSSVELQMNIENLNINIENMIAVGMIVNELVTNSLKYALNGSKKGELLIHLKKKNNNENILIVKDNGPGFPDNFNINNTNSFGLELVKALAEKIKGKVELKNNGGAEFVITFIS